MASSIACAASALALTFAAAAPASAANDAPAAAEAGPLYGLHMLQITLPVRDLDRAASFYRDRLGLKLLFVAGGAAFLDVGGVRLRLEQSATKVPTGAVELYFDDPGLSRSGRLAARGVRFLGAPTTVQRLQTTDLQLLEFTDPDGNALALMGEVPRP
jgi:catechol 2,3-dioxygenase-like lactoylglutathione lyase family enzyme